MLIAVTYFKGENTDLEHIQVKMNPESESDVRYFTLGEFLQETRFESRAQSADRNGEASVEQSEDIPDIPGQAEMVRNLVLKGELTELEEFLLKVRHRERKEIVDYRIDGSSAFFISCASNKVNIARFLLDKCGADVERKGTDSPFGWQPNLPLCSPLCCAARHVVSLPLVRLLVEHGASKKGVDETGMTTMQIACQTGSLETVLYLHEHNFDLYGVTSDGKTCLTLGVLNPYLCNFLISKGVEVDKQDKNACTALHYAVRDGQIETVKLLIRAGADVNINDRHGLDAILKAASAVQLGLVEYLMLDSKIPVSSKVLAYKLLGSSLADTGKELEAVHWWIKSSPDDCVFAKDKFVKQLISNGRKLSVGIARSSQPAEELELLEKIHSYSVQVKIEIFGLCHPQTYKSLTKLLSINFLMMNLKHSLKLLRYAAEVFVQKETQANKAAPYIASRLMKVFSRIWQNKKEVKKEDKADIIAEVLDILNKLVCHVASHFGNVGSRVNCTDLPSEYPPGMFELCAYEPENAEVFEWMCLALDLVCVTKSLQPNTNQELKLIHQLSKLIHVDPRGPSNETLLHILLTLNPHYRPYLSTDMIYRCNRLEVAKCLLQAGISINAVDVNGNIALSLLLQIDSRWIEEEKNLIDLLLDYGSDIDIRNREGETSLSLLQKAGLAVCPVNYQKLQCLAAIVIKNNNISFEEYVPKKLEWFIKCH